MYRYLQKCLYRGLCPKLSTNRNSDKEYTIGPVFLNGKVRYVIFDFTYLVTESIEKLRDKNCYEICYRAKPKLFSHILQRFSSHAARLGLANIEF